MDGRHSVDGAATTSPSTTVMAVRRCAFAALVIGTVGALTATFSRVMAGNGIDGLEVVTLVLFALSVLWLAHGFWNTVIGFVVLHGCADPLTTIFPLAARPLPTAPIQSRTAVAIPIRNEAPEPVFARLAAILDSVDDSGQASAFEFFILSDSSDERTAAEEERLFSALSARDGDGRRLHYRRRLVNTDFKGGNLRAFVDGDGHRFDFMLVLDADSLMSAAAMTRLVRLMEADPRLGIVQALIVGLPADRPFARVFQFGMRLGMRPHTVGAAWWQGDCGPYWGHNAIVRVAAFRAHCRLPRLSGRGPLAGPVLSHDQVEAALMRRAGYHVRALPVADGSYEENPPTLPDFMARDLRWCHGNMQYVRLVGRQGWHAMGRVQLLLAIFMYASAPFWLGLVLLGAGRLIADGLLTSATPASAAAQAADADTLAVTLGLMLFAIVLALSISQRWIGVLDVALRPAERRQYGGMRRLLGGAVVETLFGVLLGPVLAVAHTVFILGLPFGQKLSWAPQRRSGHVVGVGEAVSFLWPQFLFGVALSVLLTIKAPHVLPWAMPMLIGLLLAVPFAVVTADARFGRWLATRGLCAIPEETEPPTDVRRLYDRRSALGSPLSAADGSDPTARAA